MIVLITLDEVYELYKKEKPRLPKTLRDLNFGDYVSFGNSISWDIKFHWKNDPLSKMTGYRII